MGWKIFIGFITLLIIIALFIFYFFVPYTTSTFQEGTMNYNHSLSNSLSQMQFYENMRFPSKEISYKIYDCPLNKKNEMEEAFQILSNKTILKFYYVSEKEEISIKCDSKNKMEEGLFIAGEGGPTNITISGNFNVILTGNILLIRDSDCSQPNVAIHELLHVLGFNHSTNSNNILYPILKCEQTIGEDTLEAINSIYSIESYPDLQIENISATIEKGYLNASIYIKNNGLQNAKESKLIIYGDNKILEEIEITKLNIGYGVRINLNNFKLPSLVKTIEFYVEYKFNELEKNNNKIKLE